MLRRPLRQPGATSTGMGSNLCFYFTSVDIVGLDRFVGVLMYVLYRCESLPKGERGREGERLEREDQKGS